MPCSSGREDRMKDRLAKVLAWWAFLHAAAVIGGLIAHETGLRIGHVPVIDDYLNAVSAFSGAWLVMGLAPAIWATLLIWTGSPRLLPWNNS